MQNLPEAQAILSGMTVKELREIARDIHKAANDVTIPGYTKMVKAELVRMLSFEDAWMFAEMRINLMNDDADEREMNEIRAEIAEEAAYIEEGIEIDEAAAEYETLPDQVAIMKYAANDGIATAAFDGTTIGGHVTRERGRWVLRDQTHTIRAKTLGKVGKLWAKKLGFHATTVDVASMN